MLYSIKTAVKRGQANARAGLTQIDGGWRNARATHSNGRQIYCWTKSNEQASGAQQCNTQLLKSKGAHIAWEVCVLKGSDRGSKWSEE